MQTCFLVNYSKPSFLYITSVLITIHLELGIIDETTDYPKRLPCGNTIGQASGNLILEDGQNVGGGDSL